ncbi:MAG: GNAT family N-acetyltransferase [Proteobacteria bacterium]|nr:GNAT family N-acetyltransferase [Pseudomonadota bacterium]
MTVPLLRPGLAADSAAVADIYNYYVRYSTATLQDKEATVSEFTTLINHSGDERPFLVAADADNNILGYCYADVMKSRCGYRFTYESSIYLAPAAIGQGIGKTLLDALITQSKTSSAHKFVAVISLPNPTSIALHEKLGYQHCGTLPAIGWKFNRWIDCGYWLLSLKNTAPPTQTN